MARNVFAEARKLIKPEDGTILNYTYIDFHWKQQPNTHWI